MAAANADVGVATAKLYPRTWAVSWASWPCVAPISAALPAAPSAHGVRRHLAGLPPAYRAGAQARRPGAFAGRGGALRADRAAGGGGTGGRADAVHGQTRSSSATWRRRPRTAPGRRNWRACATAKSGTPYLTVLDAQLAQPAGAGRGGAGRNGLLHQPGCALQGAGRRAGRRLRKRRPRERSRPRRPADDGRGSWHHKGLAPFRPSMSDDTLSHPISWQPHQPADRVLMTLQRAGRSRSRSSPRRSTSRPGGAPTNGAAARGRPGGFRKAAARSAADPTSGSDRRRPAPFPTRTPT